MVFSVYLGIAAGVIQLVAFALYNKQVFKSTSDPNTSTWTLWAFLTVLNTSSYAAMTADAVKYILPVANSFATIGTFAYSLLAGKFKRMDRYGWIVLAIGMMAGLVWLRYKSATYANLIVVGAVAVSFIPMYRDLWKGVSKEKPLPWYLWTLAYSVSALVVVLRWRGQYQDLVYPVTMIPLHLAVALLTFREVPTTART